MQVFLRPRSRGAVLARGSLGEATNGRAYSHAVYGRQTGFTILELMASLAVAGVLLIIAIPSFRQLILSSRLTTAANDMVAAINIARMEAVKRNAAAQFCSDLGTNNQTDTLGTACSTAVQPGAVYVIKADGTASRVLGSVSSIATPLQLSGNVAALRFTTQGVAQQAGSTVPFSNTVAVICTTPPSSSFQNVRTITMTSGSIIQITPSNGTCP